MAQKKGILGYNYQNERFGILNNLDLWEHDGLHCGATLQVLIDDIWIDDRLEYSRDEWYLVKSKLRGEQLEGIKVKGDF